MSRPSMHQADNPNGSEMLNIDQAAGLLNVSRRQVERLISTGSLPGSVKIGGAHSHPRADAASMDEEGGLPEELADRSLLESARFLSIGPGGSVAGVTFSPSDRKPGARGDRQESGHQAPSLPPEGHPANARQSRAGRPTMSRYLGSTALEYRVYQYIVTSVPDLALYKHPRGRPSSYPTPTRLGRPIPSPLQAHIRLDSIHLFAVHQGAVVLTEAEVKRVALMLAGDAYVNAPPPLSLRWSRRRSMSPSWRPSSTSCFMPSESRRRRVTTAPCSL